jgi:type II secretory pathway component PulC
LQPSKKGDKKMNISEEESGLEFKVIIEMAEKYFKDKEAVQEFSYEGDKDPFSLERRKVIGGKTSYLFGELTLKGILWDSQRPLAIIDEEVVREGSIIKGMKIKKIEPDHVVLEVEGEERLLFIEGVTDMEKKEDENPKMEVMPDEKSDSVFIY